MNLIKHDYFWNDPFSEMERWFDRNFESSNRWPSLFDNLFESNVSGRFRVDIYDDSENYYVIAELPGVEKKAISIELENAVLTIEGERKFKEGDSERSYRFSRAITVGDDIAGAKTKAKIEDGLLTITLPKREELKPQAIKIS